ncbi:gamma-glutamyl-gamma-aminobutyrate hydrolase family protein [Streptococcus hongkongensis]|nr:peptidase [Streptococcus uberis]
MKRPIIGITGNENHSKEVTAWDHGIQRTFASKVFSDTILESGGLPFVLPIAHEDMVKDYIATLDKLLITGGQHILPHFYGEKQVIASSDYHEARDLFELQLVKEAFNQGKPVLSICRGTQLVNVLLGGTLNQTVSNHWQVSAPTQVTQDVDFESNSILFDIYGEKNQVNSLHMQAIKEIASDLRILARDSDDRTIEAVEGKGFSYLGLQWHPEFLLTSKPENKQVFHYFVNEMI